MLCAVKRRMCFGYKVGECGVELNQQNGIDTTIILRVICDLRIFAPHHLPTCRHEAKLTDIHLKYSPLCEHA